MHRCRHFAQLNIQSPFRASSEGGSECSTHPFGPAASVLGGWTGLGPFPLHEIPISKGPCWNASSDSHRYKTGPRGLPAGSTSMLSSLRFKDEPQTMWDVSGAQTSPWEKTRGSCTPETGACKTQHFDAVEAPRQCENIPHFHRKNVDLQAKTPCEEKGAASPPRKHHLPSPITLTRHLPSLLSLILINRRRALNYRVCLSVAIADSRPAWGPSRQRATCFLAIITSLAASLHE